MAISTAISMTISMDAPHRDVPLYQGVPLDRSAPPYRGVPPWRDTMRPVRFYLVDARLLVLLVLWLFVPAWWTTAAVVLAVTALRIAEARGYRLHSALRAVRALTAGRRPALHARRVRRFADFG